MNIFVGIRIHAEFSYLMMMMMRLEHPSTFCLAVQEEQCYYPPIFPSTFSAHKLPTPVHCSSFSALQ
jgi:hypothetical protein